jgi:hypothetical protein
MNLPQTQILGLALLILVAGCDKNKDKQDIEKQKSDAQISLAKRVLAEKEEAVKIRSNDEFEAFKRANTLFNLREYETAVGAYHEFIRDYSLSPRTVIAQQRLQDAERIIAYQKAVAQAQFQQQQIELATALAKIQEEARLKAQAQAQFRAQNQKNLGFSTIGTIKGTGSSRGDAYAAARQQLPAGAEEISTVYNSTGGSDAAGVNWTPKHYYCKITYRTH